MTYFLINSLKRGGAERVAEVLSSAINPAAVILLERDVEYDLSVPVIFLSDHTHKTSSLFKTLSIPVYALRLRRVLKKNDTVISFIERANFVNILAKIFIGHRAIITVHTPPTREFVGRKRVYRYLISILYPLADKVVSVSEGVASSLAKLCVFDKGRHVVIYNPIDLERIEQLKQQTLVEQYEKLFDSPVLITVGRLVVQKAQWNLISVFACLSERYPDLKLCIIGDGPLREDLVAYARGKGLSVFATWEGFAFDDSNEVFFLGHQENPFNVMAHARMFALTSNTEGFPMVLIEAMAVGLPIVSADCDFGPREALQKGSDEGHGVLLPTLSPLMKNVDDSSYDKRKDEWVNAIASILDDGDKRNLYRERSISRSLDFDMRKIVVEWEKIGL